VYVVPEMKTVTFPYPYFIIGNGIRSEIIENYPYFIIENGIRSEIIENRNGSGINGITKANKHGNANGNS
jgi:hypothetical protein